MFKAKAWLDLTKRKKEEEQVDSKNIRKHKNDVFRLSVLLNAEERIYILSAVYRDMKRGKGCISRFPQKGSMGSLQAR